jgi:stage IV sporulation protein FB
MHAIGGLALAPRIATIRGLEVRLHLTTLVLVGFWLLEGLGGGLGGLTYTLVVTAALFGVILWHELGHALAARRCALHVSGIMLWPLGGECQISGGMPSPRVELLVALAGPAAHAVLVALAFVPIYALAPRLVHLPVVGPTADALWSAWSLAFYILFFNLVPAFPLDGGRALRALLSYRLGDVRATAAAARTGQVFWVLVVAAAVAGYGGTMLGLLGVYMIYQAEMELRMARYAGYVYDPSARDFLAPSLGIKEDWSVEARGGTGQPGFFRRLAVRWRLKRLERETRRREALRAEVDRILAKVSREGLPALTARERRTLEHASRDYRDRH